MSELDKDQADTGPRARYAQALAWGARTVSRTPNGPLARAAVQLLMRLPRAEVLFADASGHRHVVDSRDQMGANLLMGRYRLPAAVIDLIEPGDWVVDCGANIGVITSQMCGAVGTTGLVWAIEPVPANVSRLRKLQSLNRLPQLEILAMGAGDLDGRASIGLPEPGRSGWASMTKSWDIAARSDIEVRTLDSLIASVPRTRRVSMIKLDVEGYEFEVLGGATKLLAEHGPFVYCEFNDVLLRDRGRSSIELIEVFASHGYRPLEEGILRDGALDGQVVNLLLGRP